ncbi:hypothetical protein VTN77DRAFT_5929 [Rasamsonia byssochlamydoides]|uniref:uncharacterized protein n=1 Tax=Rasamsonia byssochlamydoides TaxID=89139 RepID=UPI003742723A
MMSAAVINSGFCPAIDAPPALPKSVHDSNSSSSATHALGGNPHCSRYESQFLSLTSLPERQASPPWKSMLEASPVPFFDYKAGQKFIWKPGVRLFYSPDPVDMESNIDQSDGQALHRAVEEVLKNVESLDDLTDEVVGKLREIVPESFSIAKFHVTPLGYQRWLRGREDIRGVEYDSKENRIIVNTLPQALHTKTCNVFSTWLPEVGNGIYQETGSTYDLVRDEEFTLSGPYQGSAKQPDEGLRKMESDFPLIAVEVGASERLSKLFDDAKRWLQGSLGATKLVILVDVKEQKPKDPPVAAPSNNWALTAAQILSLSKLQLAQHIVEWGEENGSPLVGRVRVQLYFCPEGYPEQRQPNHIWEAEISHREIYNQVFHQQPIFSIRDLMPERASSTTTFEFPTDMLVVSLQKAIEALRLQRAKKIAEKRQDDLKAGASQERPQAVLSEDHGLF